MDNPLLTRCLQSLLGGNVICQYSNGALFNFLAKEDNRILVATNLRVLARDVRITSDGNAYVCCYAGIDDPDVRQACKSIFKIAVAELRPLVSWLGLCMDANPTGTPLRAGGILTTADLLQRITQSETLCNDLHKISVSSFVNSKATEPQAQLNAVLARLTSVGYLQSIGTKNLRYQATGRWSALYDQLEFIRQHESLEIPEEDPSRRLL